MQFADGDFYTNADEYTNSNTDAAGSDRVTDILLQLIGDAAKR
jgi:hypothetical protein